MKRRVKKTNNFIAFFKDKHRRLTVIPLLMMSVMLIGGTYAWFTYFSDVDTQLTGHVVGWNVDFGTDSSLEDEFDISIDEIFPGMTPFESRLQINNTGESKAYVSYTLLSYTILGETHKVGDILNGVEMDSVALENLLYTSYPFFFRFSVDGATIVSGEGTSFWARLNWDYETYKKAESTHTFSKYESYYRLVDGVYEEYPLNETTYPVALNAGLYYLNDAEDTKWGELAYEYKKANPTEPCVQMTLQVSASQITG